MKLRIVPYKMGSTSAKLLASKLSSLVGYRVWRGKPKRKALNINWGSKPHWTWDDNDKVLNDPCCVRYATDKRLAFKTWDEAGVSCVPWTTDKEVAAEWLKNGAKVLARTACQQAGSGIKVIEPGAELPDAELYTRYVPKKKEFRVHVFGNQAILVQEKRKKKGVTSDYLIRSNHKGWVFCLKDIAEPDGLRDLGVAAVRTLGLDFGAVDVIYNEKLNKLFVLEVNSAPGLCTPTLEAYANAIAAS